jgi:adenosylmethionine-8-amino-7-oxononanoate aminotransferase
MLSKQIHEEFKKLSTGTLLHGYTYSGHAMACAVALKNIELIEKENLIENAKIMGKELLAGLKRIQGKRKIVGEVRGLGLMAAIEFIDKNHKSPVSPLIVNEAAKRGLICRSVLFDGQDTIVIAPPLIINSEEVLKVIRILEDSIHEIESNV